MSRTEDLLKQLAEIDNKYNNAKSSFWRQNEIFANICNEKILVLNSFEIPYEIDVLERLLELCESNAAILKVQESAEYIHSKKSKHPDL